MSAAGGRRALETAPRASFAAARASWLGGALLASALAGCGGPAEPATSALVLPAPPSAEPVAAAPPPKPSRRGLGIGEFYLGQSERELLDLAGPPPITRSTDEEAELWRGSGYDPEAEGPFLVGFDHVLEYEQSETAQRGEHAPLFKAFIRRGRIVALTFTAYGVEDARVRGLGLPPCTFHAPEAAIAQRFGPAEAVEPSGSGHEHLYPSQGVSVITENGSVLVIHLHDPLDEADARKVRERVRPPEPVDVP